MGEDPVRINQFLDVVFSYGPFWVYAVIFIACFIENIFPPFPGDSFIAVAGGLTVIGRLDLITVFMVIISGGISSVMILYLMGKKFGRDFFIKKNYKYFSAQDIINMEKYFQKWGSLILVLSRFVVGFRSVLALVAGISRFHSIKMAGYSIISYILFTGLLMYIAIQLVENMELLRLYFRTYQMIIFPILIILIALYIIRKFLAMRKRL